MSSRIPRRLSSVMLTARQAASRSATSSVFGATRPSSEPRPPPRPVADPVAGPAPGPRYSSVCAALACRFFNPPDEEGEDYKGGRDLDSLRKFASTELGPGCSVDTLENCDDAQKARPHPPPTPSPSPFPSPPTITLLLYHHPSPSPSPSPLAQPSPSLYPPSTTLTPLALALTRRSWRSTSPCPRTSATRS